MEAFRDQFTATELLSYKEVLYEGAMGEWYAQRDPDEVEREDNGLHMFSSTIRGFHLCTLSIINTENSNISQELPLTRVLYITVG